MCIEEIRLNGREARDQNHHQKRRRIRTNMDLLGILEMKEHITIHPPQELLSGISYSED